MNEIQALRAEQQRWRDKTFLVVLALLLATAAYAVIRSMYPPHRRYVTAAGEIRPVDPATLQRQLRSGRLSRHEAAHWQRVGALPARPAPARGKR
jgi:hypothetical protein